MTGAFAQHRIDAGAEGVQKIEGYEGLHRTGKTAAVDTVSALALEVMLAQTQSNSHNLYTNQVKPQQQTKHGTKAGTAGNTQGIRSGQRIGKETLKSTSCGR